VDGGLGDLIYGRALNDGGMGGSCGDGGVHLHGSCFGREWSACRVGGENEASTSVGWARDRQEGRGGRTHALSGPTHFGPKSEAEMGAHGQARTVLSVWVGPLSCGFPIFSVRADTFGREVVVWVGPLEMPLTRGVGVGARGRSISRSDCKTPTFKIRIWPPYLCFIVSLALAQSVTINETIK
jgi:hypothetical protein